MVTTEQSNDEAHLHRLAHELGLERVLTTDRDTFIAALSTARSLSERIARPRSLYDEPAHVFVFPDRSAEREDEA